MKPNLFLKTIGLAWLALVLLSSCGSGERFKLNRFVTLWRGSRIPYGTFVAYESLPHLFPNAAISINTAPPSDLGTPEKKAAYIIICHNMSPDSAELSGLLNFVAQGNHVFISSLKFGDSLLHHLHLQEDPRSQFAIFPDSLQVSVKNPVIGDSLTFVYPGDAYDGGIKSYDSQFTSILGRDSYGRPNFVRFNYKGGGTLYLHFAPMALTNFFLLHKENIRYYDNVFSYLPATVDKVIWDDYFRYGRSSFSAFRYILKNPGLRWAFWLVLLLFAIIFIFDSKRRQRVVPVIAVLRNTSLDFVKTIGRLYYQRRDNQNLALKMVAHFQDHVRTRFNLPVTTLDEDFVDRLSYKTGFEKQSLQDLVEYIKLLPAKRSVSDTELLDFQRRLDLFYKKA